MIGEQVTVRAETTTPVGPRGFVADVTVTDRVARWIDAGYLTVLDIPDPGSAPAPASEIPASAAPSTDPTRSPVFEEDGQPAQVDLSRSTAEAVLADVDSGALAVEDALASERAGRDRVGLTDELRARLDVEDRDDG